MKYYIKTKWILFTGIAFLILGFIFDIVYINIPPQDPPAYLIKERANLYETLDILYTTGYTFIILAICSEIFRRIRKYLI